MRSCFVKPVVIPFLAVSATLASNAGNIVFDNPDNRLCWGVRVNLDVSAPGAWKNDLFSMKMFNSRIGFSAGGYMQLPVVANLYFEPGVSLFYDTYSNDIGIGEDNGTVKDVRAHTDKFGVRMPLDLGYRFDIWENASLFVRTGPQLTYGFTMKTHLPSEDSLEDFSDGWYGKDGLLNRFDILWDIAAGIEFGRINVGVEYNLGLLNIARNKEHGLDYKENYFRVGVGYTF